MIIMNTWYKISDYARGMMRPETWHSIRAIQSQERMNQLKNETIRYTTPNAQVSSMWRGNYGASVSVNHFCSIDIISEKHPAQRCMILVKN